MEDQYNLIYNGKMLHGMDGYAKTLISASYVFFMDSVDKPACCAGSYVFPVNPTNYNESYRGYIPLIPYLCDDTYKLSFQFKDNGSTANAQYSCLLPYDNKGKYISIEEANAQNANTITTLAQDLNNGDTIVYLTSVANWFADYDYRVFGVIESAAYGDNRTLVWQYISQDGIDSTNNTITLRYAWTGGTYKAGSKVREFSSGSTFIYPVAWTAKPNDWILREKTFEQSFDSRLPFSYFLGFGTIYTKGKIADLRFENLSKSQARVPNGTDMIPLFANSGWGTIDDYSESTSSVNQYGQLNTGMLSEGFLPVRYIRDWANGNSGNEWSQWCEIQAFDRWGRNVAFAADGSWDGSYSSYDSRLGLNKNNTTTYKPLHIISNENITYNDNIGKIGKANVVLDMGIIHCINKIKVWHLWGDSRTYHNTKTEVSVDGVNWITVFDSAIEGEYAESSEGHTITFDKLGTLYHASMRKGGETLVQDIIED